MTWTEAFIQSGQADACLFAMWIGIAAIMMVVAPEA